MRPRRVSTFVRLGSLLVIAAFALVPACDDGTETTSTSSSTDAASSAAVTSGGGGAMANVSGLIEQTGFQLDCQPPIAADPVSGSFTVKYVNDGLLEGELDIVDAKIIFTSNAKTLTWTFDVTPTESGNVPAGQSTTLTHTKEPGGVGSEAGSPCDFCKGTAEIEITWKTGQLQKVGKKSIGLVQCAM